MSVDDGLSLPIPLPLLVGIYALTAGDRVIYVGQSVNIVARVQQHQATKTFDGAFILGLCERDELNAAEGRYIHEYHPPLNGTPCPVCRRRPSDNTRAKTIILPPSDSELAPVNVTEEAVKVEEDKRAYSVEEVAEMTGLSRSLIYDEMNAERLGYIKVGRRRIITRQQLDAFLAVSAA
jgi:excisionase family DNA binding protein